MAGKCKILAVSPYDSMIPLVHKVAAEFDEIELVTAVGNLDKGLACAVENYSENYDFIISRGATASCIRNGVSVPVIEIETTAYDVLNTLNYVSAANERLAVVGFANIIRPIQVFEQTLPYQYKTFTIGEVGDLAQTFAQIRKEGISSVLCDTISYQTARKQGFNAFLITSSEESIRAALRNALFCHKVTGQLKEERLFFQELLARNKESESVVYTEDRRLFYSTLVNLQSADSLFALDFLHQKLDDFAQADNFRFSKQRGDSIYRGTARKITVLDRTYLAFFFSCRSVAARKDRPGLAYFDSREVAEENEQSVFSIIHLERYYEKEIAQTLLQKTPVLICGDFGTGKDFLAREIYLCGGQRFNPLVIINCSRINDHTWNYIMTKEDSPLCSRNSTLFFKNVDALSPVKLVQLLAILPTDDTSNANRIIFSCSMSENMGESAVLPARRIANMFPSRVISMMTLHGQAAEIDTFTQLYMEHLQQLRPQASQRISAEARVLLQHYAWPQNHIQLLRVVETLAVQAEDREITAADVDTQLRSEMLFVQGEAPLAARTFIDISQDLKSISRSIVNIVLEQHDGNMSAAARSLDVSRTTLWRMLKD